MTASAPIIVWFRQDLRLFDNPALHTAAQTGAPILPVYILDDVSPGPWKMGAASRVWLHHSLAALNQSLHHTMLFLSGDARTVLPELVTQVGARGVYWNRLYEPWAITRDTQIKETLKSSGREVHSFNTGLMYEPWAVTKPDGTPYRVFTPFWRKGCAGLGAPPAPVAAPKNLNLHTISGAPIDSLGLLPTAPRWDTPMMTHWTPGEDGAQARWQDFLANGLSGYKENRNRPDLPAHTSGLSPHLHFGEISPRQLFHDTSAAIAADLTLQNDGDHFLSELGWREFSHHLLFHNPSLPEHPLQPKFAAFPWVDDAPAVQKWQRGQTGFPIVDAGLRQLWATGYMHNRVRMIVGSFLVKNMLTHWRVGEDWFWDTLFDADLANNAASWQWIAGCGADAAPYFRIFNPVLQGEKFDPNGDYVRQYVPELANFPTEFIHRPWDAPDLLRPRDYPPPLMDHSGARDRALAALAQIK
jgi:deoxyribodipyrimidine photo-lyase